MVFLGECFLVQPLVGAGVSGPIGRSIRPRPEFPVPGAGVSACAFLVWKWFTPWWGPEFPPPGGRSFRCRPESPATLAGNSGVISGCNGSFSGRGINTPPPSSSQLAEPSNLCFLSPPLLQAHFLDISQSLHPNSLIFGGLKEKT